MVMMIDWVLFGLNIEDRNVVVCGGMRAEARVQWGGFCAEMMMDW
jgi:hypothetical protein